jgi:hypothetical protein
MPCRVKRAGHIWRIKIWFAAVTKREALGERQVGLMLENLTRSSFSEQLNSKFQLFIEAETAVEIELVEVEQRRSTPRQEQFSVVFRMPASVPARQGVYRMKHDNLGEFEIFLVPYKREQDSIYFEAFFNRLL